MESKVSKADITELKSLANPPVQVIQVFQAVLLLLGYSERDSKKWISAKKCIADPSFLSRLKSFDPASVSADTRQRVQEYLTCLSHEKLIKVSRAVCGLYHWAVHMSG